MFPNDQSSVPPYFLGMFSLSTYFSSVERMFLSLRMKILDYDFMCQLTDADANLQYLPQ